MQAFLALLYEGGHIRDSDKILAIIIHHKHLSGSFLTRNLNANAEINVYDEDNMNDANANVKVHVEEDGNGIGDEVGANDTQDANFEVDVRDAEEANEAEGMTQMKMQLKVNDTQDSIK